MNFSLCIELWFKYSGNFFRAGEILRTFKNKQFVRQLLHPPYIAQLRPVIRRLDRKNLSTYCEQIDVKLKNDGMSVKIPPVHYLLRINQNTYMR